MATTSCGDKLKMKINTKTLFSADFSYFKAISVLFRIMSRVFTTTSEREKRPVASTGYIVARTQRTGLCPQQIVVPSQQAGLCAQRLIAPAQR
jgi:hypothetical protein